MLVSIGTYRVIALLEVMYLQRTFKKSTHGHCSKKEGPSELVWVIPYSFRVDFW